MDDYTLDWKYISPTKISISSISKIIDNSTFNSIPAEYLGLTDARDDKCYVLVLPGGGNRV